MNDGLLASVRVVEAMGRILIDDLAVRGAATAAIPRRLEGLDAPWLESALQSVFPGVAIESVEFRGGHSGTTTRERIAPAYANDARATDLPGTIFVKITPSSFGTRLFGAVLELGRGEVRFYTEIANALPIPLPRVYCARAAERGGRFVLLLEDLDARGCRFPRRTLDLEEARSVVRSLGEMHAAFWGSRRFEEDLRWLRAFDNRPNAALERWISARANAPCLERFGECVSDDVRRLSPRIHEYREALEAAWGSGTQTLLHGDCHMGNMFFDGSRAGFFDWQVVQRGQGIRDVTYFMVNSLETSLRRNHEEELLDLYRATLREGGVEEAGLDRVQMHDAYRAHALYVWISSAVTAATPGLQPRETARNAVARTATALDDLGSFERLDEIIAEARHPSSRVG